ncbi:hypothetical protein ACERNI_09055 [Camelimonas sp. ID_303_24]
MKYDLEKYVIKSTETPILSHSVKRYETIEINLVGPGGRGFESRLPDHFFILSMAQKLEADASGCFAFAAPGLPGFPVR